METAIMGDGAELGHHRAMQRVEKLEAALENAAYCMNAGPGLCDACRRSAWALLSETINPARFRRVVSGEAK
jgi:hypothetical protein